MIVEIKQFSNPPKGVEFVMQCVMIMLGKKTDWKSVQATLSDVNGFMQSLLEYNVEDKTDKMWKRAREGYINKPEFEPA
jgi:dynein heavy chain